VQRDRLGEDAATVAGEGGIHPVLVDVTVEDPALLAVLVEAENPRARLNASERRAMTFVR